MTEKKFKQLLQKYFDGKATDAEAALIKKFEDYFTHTGEEKVFTNAQTKERLNAEIFSGVQSHMNTNGYYWLRIAAAVVVLVGVGLGAYFFTDTLPNNTIVYNKGNAPKELVLADGSVVTLNINSQLEYTENFNTEMRNVKLKGEAFFKVAKNPEKPFIIKTGDLQTRVVGTQFNIKQRSQDIKVTVTEGQVKVYHQKDTVNLVLNEQGIFDVPSGSLTELPVTAGLYNLWQHERVTLSGISMEDFSKVLTELYDVTYEFKDDDAKNVLVSVGFRRGEELDKIINRINLLNEVKITHNTAKNNMILIEKVD
ncbi:hypothetical protein NBRC110019_15890 [Neptunitalea chrysea]|uniref:FecR family protein n=1 Tax=Neptunitalea chrysea TaxID=1647581 RepID=A0A9W6EUF8_9FLAO|nr:FecR family protein [Neptunitalea chrysea]GLB52549.1 hypothetical protein NBRC110019_15890 [Neptunitalea chrysea]